MRLKKPLNDILGNRIRIEILRTLFKYPGEFTGRHIARLSNLPQASVQRQLKILVNNQLLHAKQVGAGKSFSLNTQSFVYPNLKKLFDDESRLFIVLQKLIDQAINKSSYLRNSLIHASMYGSVVRGEESPQSDIDLFLLFQSSFNEQRIQQAFESVDQEIVAVSGMHLHPFAVSVDELNNINERLIDEVKNNSKKIYGRELRDIDLIKLNNDKTD